MSLINAFKKQDPNFKASVSKPSTGNYKTYTMQNANKNALPRISEKEKYLSSKHYIKKNGITFDEKKRRKIFKYWEDYQAPPYIDTAINDLDVINYRVPLSDIKKKVEEMEKIISEQYEKKRIYLKTEGFEYESYPAQDLDYGRYSPGFSGWRHHSLTSLSITTDQVDKLPLNVITDWVIKSKTELSHKVVLKISSKEDLEKQLEEKLKEEKEQKKLEEEQKILEEARRNKELIIAEKVREEKHKKLQEEIERIRKKRETEEYKESLGKCKAFISEHNEDENILKQQTAGTRKKMRHRRSAKSLKKRRS